MHRDKSDRYEVSLAPSLAGHKRLGSYLVEAGLINRGQVEVALNDQKATGMRFGEILVTRGWIKQQTVEYFMDKLVLPERKVKARRISTAPTTSSTPSTAQQTRQPGRSHASAPGSSPRPTVDVHPTHSQDKTTIQPTSDHAGKKKKKIPPITKPLPSVPSGQDGVNWVG